MGGSSGGSPVLNGECYWEFEMELDRFVMEYVGMKVGLIRAEHVEVTFAVEPWHMRTGLLMWTFTKLGGGSLSYIMYSSIVRLRATLSHMLFEVELYSNLPLFFSWK